MNAETGISKQDNAQEQGITDLLKNGASGLGDYTKKAENLKASLDKLAEIGDDNTVNSVLKLKRQLDDFEPSVTMIGQVKAGKTSLVNAMVGESDLLPADVNPWTSVVTSLHLDPKENLTGQKALFKFFDDTEWNRLLQNGGRIGELASRAGADDELETVRKQIEQMREKSRARLGKRFELLLGQEHDYGYFDKELIERYVCLGDDFDDEDEDEDAPYTQGRFADITKSADLFLHRPDFKTKLCIRDTPGVNDTFMMREQITIRAIRGSRLCVVVLSAHQALSTVDMALIRLISNIKSREVIIFVNRIDELSDPARQVPEIRESIRNTLKDQDGPADAQIIFGSAYWANNALQGTVDDMAQDSSASLVKWAESQLTEYEGLESPPEMVWELSGVPALYAALSERITEGVGQEVIDKVARSAVNLANSMQATNQVVSLHAGKVSVAPVNKDEIEIKLLEVEARGYDELRQKFETLITQFQARAERSHQSFLERATASLIKHLERYGEGAVWHYDPAGLRVLLRTSYKVFGVKTHNTAQKVFDSSAQEIRDIYTQAFTSLGADFKIEAPRPARIAPPVFLGQTIALDMQGSWWKSWWQRRRGYQALASGFHKMIMDETDPIVSELKDAQAKSIYDSAKSILTEFFEEQRTTLMGIIEQSDASPEELKNLLGVHASEDRKNVVDMTLNTLNRYVA